MPWLELGMGGQTCAKRNGTPNPIDFPIRYYYYYYFREKEPLRRHSRAHGFSLPLHPLVWETGGLVYGHLALESHSLGWQVRRLH